MGGVSVNLMSTNNQTIATLKTNNEGIAISKTLNRKAKDLLHRW